MKRTLRHHWTRRGNDEYVHEVHGVVMRGTDRKWYAYPAKAHGRQGNGFTTHLGAQEFCKKWRP